MYNFLNVKNIFICLNFEWYLKEVVVIYNKSYLEIKRTNYASSHILIIFYELYRIKKIQKWVWYILSEVLGSERNIIHDNLMINVLIYQTIIFNLKVILY